MTLLDRYILRAVVTPLVLALMVAGALLLLEQMLRLFDFVLAEQGPVDVVWRMLANLLPHYMSLALPLGTFLGILLAFRNLSLSSELDALNSSGASAARLLRPVYALVLVLAAADFLLVSYVQPFAGYRYQQIKFDVTSGALGIRIPQGEFIDITANTTIRLGKINPATREVEGIFLEQRALSGARTIITASYGGLAATPEMTRLLLTMREGRQLIIDSKGEHANALSFDSLDVDIALPAIAMFRPRGDEGEATFDELAAIMKAGNRADPLWHVHQASFHWQLLHPLTFLVLPILAVATGVTGRRRASSLKPILGMAIVIVYHELIEEWGQVMVEKGALSPYLAMWGVFAAFVIISVLMYRGSIDRARAAKAMSRGDEPVVRVLSDSELDEETLGLRAEEAAR